MANTHHACGGLLPAFPEAVNRERLTHWGRVTHICVGKLTIIGSDNGLSPGRRQAIIWTNAGILLIGPLGTNFSEILIAIEAFSFKKMHLEISSAKWRPFCLCLNLLTRGFISVVYLWWQNHGSGQKAPLCGKVFSVYAHIKMAPIEVNKNWTLCGMHGRNTT